MILIGKVDRMIVRMEILLARWIYILDMLRGLLTELAVLLGVQGLLYL